MKSKNYTKILLLWYMQGDNFGDVLIYDTVSTFLTDNGFRVESHEVGDRIEKIFEHANQCDFLLFAGGGIVERYLPEVIREFENNYDNLLVPYGVMGFGMGEFDYSIYKQTFAFFVDNSTFFYVRDMHSKILLDSFAGSEKVIYSADCVFANKRIRKLQHVKGVKHGINIRKLPYKDLTGDFDWKEIGRIVKQIECDYVIPDSNNEIEKLDIGVKNKYELSQIKSYDAVEKAVYTIHSIRQCEWIVAMRFHVVLVAAIMGIITVPILYCPKVKYLAEQLGISDLAIDINDVKSIPYKIQKVNDNYSTDILEFNVNIMKKKADKMFEEILHILTKSNK